MEDTGNTASSKPRGARRTAGALNTAGQRQTSGKAGTLAVSVKFGACSVYNVNPKERTEAGLYKTKANEIWWICYLHRSLMTVTGTNQPSPKFKHLAVSPHFACLPRTSVQQKPCKAACLEVPFYFFVVERICKPSKS